MGPVADKLFAIPWERLSLDAENKRFVLDVDKGSLDDAPGFDKNEWPDVDTNYMTTIYTYYGAQPYWMP